VTLWAAVDALVAPRHVKLWRDVDGRSWSEWTTIPSLWWQLEEDTLALGDAGGGGSRSNSYRSPANLDCLQLWADVHDTIADALTGHDALTLELLASTSPLRLNTPPALRRLANIVTTVNDDDFTGYWTERITSWARQITTLLRLTEQPQPRRIRDTSCPTCQATHVTIDTDSGPERVPALLIDFHGTLVRAASCTACGSNWFRGDGLLELADLVAATRRESLASGGIA